MEANVYINIVTVNYERIAFDFDYNDHLADYSSCSDNESDSGVYDPCI